MLLKFSSDMRTLVDACIWTTAATGSVHSVGDNALISGFWNWPIGVNWNFAKHEGQTVSIRDNTIDMDEFIVDTTSYSLIVLLDNIYLIGRKLSELHLTWRREHQ